MFVALALLVNVVAAEPEVYSNDNIAVKGKVVGLDGKPVPGAALAPHWSPLGWYDESGKRCAIGEPNPPEDPTKWNMGAMLPNVNGLNSKTDEHGEFRTFIKPKQSILMAFDESQDQCGILDFDPVHQSGDVLIQLRPSIEVEGRMVLKTTGQPPKWSVVCVELADPPINPIATRRFLICWSIDGVFRFKLPPGKYELACNTDVGENDNMIRSEPKIIELWESNRRVSVGDLVLGTFEQSRDDRIRIAKEQNRAGEVTELIGKPMPPWFVTDGRGLDLAKGPEQYKGKWLLVYFWHSQCGPCAGKEVPRLSKFVADEKTDFNKLAVVSFIIGAKNWKSIADADRYLEPIAQRYWTQPWTKLPLAFDSTDRTRESIAEELFGQWVLVDPQGLITATGLDTDEGLDQLKKRAGL